MANSDFVTLGQSKSQLKAIKKYINDKFRDYDKQSSGDSISGGWIYNSDTSIAAYERVYEYRKKNEVAIQPVQALNKLTISGQKVTIPAGEIKATVDAENYFLTFNGSGNDTIKILDSAENVSLNAGNGNNFITNSSAGCVISCGTGADTIISDGSGCSVIGGTGNDYLYVVGGSCSVEGGAGNNLVTISGGNNLDLEFYASHIDLALAKNFNSQIDAGGLSDLYGTIQSTAHKRAIHYPLSAAVTKMFLSVTVIWTILQAVPLQMGLTTLIIIPMFTAILRIRI